jgi:hypothetical protein
MPHSGHRVTFAGRQHVAHTHTSREFFASYSRREEKARLAGNGHSELYKRPALIDDRASTSLFPEHVMAQAIRITGATSGISRATAGHFADEGRLRERTYHISIMGAV